MTTIDIRLRVSKAMKAEAEEIFKQIGMTMPEAMRVFLNQCINTGGLPFRPHVSVPNEETLAAFEQGEKGDTRKYSLEQFETLLDEVNKR